MNTVIGSLVCFGLVAGTLGLVVVPRLAARTARRRLQHPDRQSVNWLDSTPPNDIRWAEFLEQWSRSCKAGSSLHSGFLLAFDQFPDLEVHLGHVAHTLRRGGSLVDSLEAASPTNPRVPRQWRRVLHLVGRTLRAAPLDREAERLRRSESERLEVESQLATLRTSLRVLSWAPLGVSALILLSSSTARHFMFGSGVGVLLVVFGFSLQLTGRAWITRLLEPPVVPPDADLVEDIASALEAGFTAHQALMLAKLGATSTGRAPGSVELLDDLRLDFPALAPAFDLLAGTSTHGLPLADRLNEFAADMRARCAEESRAHIRRMSVKANVPLVVCVLPSFLVLSLVPLVVSIIAPLGSGAR